MLLVNNLSKYYGKFCALKDINLEFDNGIYGLIAPNGAGKTTLIKMLTTLIFPTKGEILYNGTNIVDMDDEYRDILGYLPQEFGYYKNYTPTQFLMYLSALKGIDKNKAEKKIKELLELVAIDDAADKKMKKFSGGMIQRVGIAQALLNDPKILILDEPTAGLDPKERMRFKNIISELSRDRIIIISTHIVSDIEFIANEIVMIKDHRILYKDSTSNICKSIEDKVYETEIQFNDSHDFKKKYISLSERQEGENMKIRFICENKEEIKSTWAKVNPNLEDVFLYEYNDNLKEK